MVWSREIFELILLGGVTGLMAGCTGVGGVFLVPGLVYGLGMDFRRAISTVMFAFIASGTVGIWTFARRKSIRWDIAAWLFLGAAPFAFLGSWAVDVVSVRALQAFLSILTLSSGAYSFLRSPIVGTDRSIPSYGLSPIGAITGFLSALTGTGGAVVLMPILLSISVAPLTAIGLSTAVQLPIALVATLGNYVNGNLDFRTGIVLSIVFTVGFGVGARIAHVLPQRHLHRLLAATLLSVGTFIGVRALMQ